MKKKPPLVLAHLGGIIFSHLSSYYNAISLYGLQAKKALPKQDFRLQYEQGLYYPPCPLKSIPCSRSTEFFRNHGNSPYPVLRCQQGLMPRRTDKARVFH